MGKVFAAFVLLALSGLGVLAGQQQAATFQQIGPTPRTMEEVIDRVIANENKRDTQIKTFSPLVETYIQNLKVDKDLGHVPAGDKYFLGRAEFYDLAHVHENNIVRNSPCLAQYVGNQYNSVFLLQAHKKVLDN